MKEGKVIQQTKKIILAELTPVLSLHLRMLRVIWDLSQFQQVSSRMMKVKRRAISAQEKSTPLGKTITKIQGHCLVLIKELLSVGHLVLRIGLALSLTSSFQSLK